MSLGQTRVLLIPRAFPLSALVGRLGTLTQWFSEEAETSCILAYKYLAVKQTKKYKNVATNTDVNRHAGVMGSMHTLLLLR